MTLLGEGPDMPTRYPPQSLRVDRVVAPANLPKGKRSRRAAKATRAARPRTTRGRGRR